MKETFLNIKNQIARRFRGEAHEAPEEDLDARPDYVELTHETDEQRKAKVRVQQFVISDFEDVKPILDALRKGTTIALVNIQPLKEKDIIELKRAISKLKKTCDAISGDLAGFGDNFVVATPELAYIYRSGDDDAVSAKAATPGPQDELEE